MKTVIEELIKRIKDTIPADFITVSAWNNQLQSEENGVGFNLVHPSCLFEIQQQVIEQLGAGIQLINFNLVVHIIHNNFNNLPYTQDCDLLIIDLADKVYTSLQRFEPSQCVELVRTDQEFDYDHDNTVHCTQTYSSNYLDNLAKTYQLFVTTDKTNTKITVNGQAN